MRVAVTMCTMNVSYLTHSIQSFLSSQNTGVIKCHSLLRYKDDRSIGGAVAIEVFFHENNISKASILSHRTFNLLPSHSAMTLALHTKLCQKSFSAVICICVYGEEFFPLFFHAWWTCSVLSALLFHYSRSRKCHSRPSSCVCSTTQQEIQVQWTWCTSQINSPPLPTRLRQSLGDGPRS